MYMKLESLFLEYTREAMLEPYCEEQEPEMKCPECSTWCDWISRRGLFFCPECQQHHQIPCDNDYEEELAYGY